MLDWQGLTMAGSLSLSLRVLGAVMPRPVSDSEFYYACPANVGLGALEPGPGGLTMAVTVRASASVLPASQACQPNSDSECRSLVETRDS